MTEKVNIYSDEWCDMIFEDKNREYGAFVLRKGSSKRHIKAIIIAVVFFTLAVSSPVILKTILKDKKEQMVEVTSMSKVKVEPVKKDENKINEEPPPPPLKSSIKFVPPVITNEEVNEEDQPKTQEELNESKVNISVATVKGTDEENGVDISTLNDNKEIAGDGAGETPFTIVEQQPEFPGGESERLKFLSSKHNYPTMAREAGIEGTVFVTFVVGRTGKITNVKILRGVGGGLDEEAIRLVKLMPDWKPGKQNGQAVPVQFNMPIKFSLQ